MLRVSRRFRLGAALAVVVPLIVAGWVYRKAKQAFTDSVAETASETRIPFTVSSLNRHAPPGIRPILSPPAYRDIAVFQGSIYISGATGLYRYQESGVLNRSYRAGIELPPAELGALAVSNLPGHAGDELFIATSGEGLLAFDGLTFQQILPGRPAYRKITALLPLSTGRLLFGTENDGVGSFDGHAITKLDSALDSQHITALAGIESDIWIGTLQQGLWRLHAGQMDRLRDTLPDPQVLSLASVGDRLYAGTPLGAVEFRNGQKTRNVANGLFARALLATENTLTVGSQDEGLVDVDLRTRPDHDHVPDGEVAPEPILRLAIFGGKPIALSETAVFRKDGSRWNRAFDAGKTVLSDRNVSALDVDRAGNLWVGFFDRGLDIISGESSARHLEDDRLFCVNRIAAAPNWQGTAVATANGLVMFDATNQVRQVLGRKDGLLADHITDVAFHEGGMVAATPAGLSYIDSGGIRSLYVFQGLVNNHVYALASLGDEVLAGTLGGLSVLDHEVVRANYTTANSGLKHNWITAVARVGDEWFAGTYGAGVLRLDKDGRWDTFPDLSKYVVNPHALLVTRSHVLAGSLDRGMYVYDLASRRWSSYSEGLPSRNVTAFAEANDGIFVGTANGVVKIDEQVLP